LFTKLFKNNFGHRSTTSIGGAVVNGGKKDENLKACLLEASRPRDFPAAYTYTAKAGFGA
jgi:hypothetical protein